MNIKHKPPGVVFDCMVFLQAAANRNSVAARALRLVETGEIKLFVSRKVINEVQNVFSRPKIRAQLKGITDTTVSSLLLLLKRYAHFVRDVPEVFKYPPRSKG